MGFRATLRGLPLAVSAPGGTFILGDMITLITFCGNGMT